MRRGAREREARLLHWVGNSLFGGPLSRLHASILMLTRGRFSPRWFQGAPLLTLQVRGRKSGKRFQIPLVFAEHPDGWVVIASNGGAERTPNWALNLEAAGEAKVCLRGRTYEVEPHFFARQEARAVRKEYEKTYPTVTDYEQFTAREFPVILLRRQTADP